MQNSRFRHPDVAARKRLTSNVTRMNPVTAYKRRAEFRFLDVRDRGQWHRGTIGGSLNVPLFDLPKITSRLRETDRVVVICNSGLLADVAAAWLTSRGFRAVSIDGGLEAWVRSELPLVSSDGRRGELVA